MSDEELAERELRLVTVQPNLQSEGSLNIGVNLRAEDRLKQRMTDAGMAEAVYAEMVSDASQRYEALETEIQDAENIVPQTPILGKIEDYMTMEEITSLLSSEAKPSVLNSSSNLGGVYTIATYTYRPDGLRKSKTVGSAATRHIWVGGNVVGNVYCYPDYSYVYTYYQGHNMIYDLGTYYTYDHKGSIVKFYNEAGNFGQEYGYDAFGVETNTSGRGFTPFGYCGEYTDYETGYVYLRNRYYDPSIGRFITEDPIQDGTNWYAYCNNNPIMFIDPWGLKKQGEVIGISMYISNDVRLIQQKLNAEGYTGYNGNVLKCDGVYGSSTQYAVKRYQEDHGLSIDGLVGDETWQSMGFALSERLPTIGIPNSKGILYNPDGTPKRVREYGEDGRVKKDTDYNHGGVGHEFPHEHEWDWSKDNPRQPENTSKSDISTLTRVGMVVCGVVVIVGTVVEDIGTGGVGIANDMQMFQQGIFQILQAFK